MKIELKRIYNCPKYCIGHIYVDGQYVCDSIEDVDRMLDQSMSEKDILKVKVKSQTAIPTGTYNVLMNVVSPKFSLKQYYMDVCKGRVPRLDNVKGFVGILMHCGRTQLDSAGCIIVGKNLVKGQVLQSKQCFEKLYHLMDISHRIGDRITITITRTY